MLEFLLLKQLFDEILENNIECSDTKKENLNLILDEIFKKYQDDPIYILSLLNKLKALGYDLCVIWRLICKIISFKRYSNQICEINKLLSTLPEDIICDLFKQYEKTATSKNTDNTSRVRSINSSFDR